MPTERIKTAWCTIRTSPSFRIVLVVAVVNAVVWAGVGGVLVSGVALNFLGGKKGANVICVYCIISISIREFPFVLTFCSSFHSIRLPLIHQTVYFPFYLI